MMIVVPLHQAYIEANYRELALRHMRPGQHVRIHIDAYDVWLDGYRRKPACSIGWRAIADPAQQRDGQFHQDRPALCRSRSCPIPNQPLARLLRIGMSVETIVDTHLDDVVAAEGRQPVAQRAPGQVVSSVMRRFALTAALLLSRAARSGPNFERPKVDTPTAYGNEPTNVVSRTYGGEVDTRWWTSFRDPELSALVDRLGKQNLDLQSAAERVQQARSERDVAASQGTAASRCDAQIYPRAREPQWHDIAPGASAGRATDLQSVPADGPGGLGARSVRPRPPRGRGGGGREAGDDRGAARDRALRQSPNSRRIICSFASCRRSRPMSATT